MIAKLKHEKVINIFELKRNTDGDVSKKNTRTRY